MAILLDTCAAIWIVAGAKIDAKAEDALDQARDLAEPVFVSAVTAWEIGLLASKGRFASPYSPKVWFDKLMSIETFRLLDVTPALLIDSCFLPGNPPRDPGDRLIIATARDDSLTVMTRDRQILAYGSAGHVLTMVC